MTNRANTIPMSTAHMALSMITDRLKKINVSDRRMLLGVTLAEPASSGVQETSYMCKRERGQPQMEPAYVLWRSPLKNEEIYSGLDERVKHGLLPQNVTSQRDMQRVEADCCEHSAS